MKQKVSLGESTRNSTLRLPARRVTIACETRYDCLRDALRLRKDAEDDNFEFRYFVF